VHLTDSYEWQHETGFLYPADLFNTTNNFFSFPAPPSPPVQLLLHKGLSAFCCDQSPSYILTENHKILQPLWPQAKISVVGAYALKLFMADKNLPIVVGLVLHAII
jgi:hypothetical protein